MRIHRNPFRALPLLAALAASTPPVRAQAAGPAPEDWLVHGQSTYILQGHGAFPSPYEGDNSLQPRREAFGSFSATLYLGYRPWQGGELYVTPELLGGRGVSSVLGLAGAPNGEIYRVNNPDVRPSLSRLFLRQTWDLPGGTSQAVEDGPMSLAGSRSSRRFTLTAGKVAMNDIYDLNTYVADPRTGFMNWALMDTGSWDYPADTRGYSWGLTFELAWDAWSARLGSYMEPRHANQMEFDHQVSRAHGDVLELEHDHKLGDLPGKTSVMIYANHARMGVYSEALAQDPAAPSVVSTEAPGRIKYGYSFNGEQALTADLGLFCRAGWNDGKTETWAFTEIDRTFALGLAAQGAAWGRPEDRLGAAVLVNGLSPEHRAYLASGGLGFILGDGRLDYAQERISEAFYTVGLGKRFSLSLDYQHAWNPGYNRDRGPVDLFALRLHAQF
jgi:high affinity Mn2+ porin